MSEPAKPEPDEDLLEFLGGIDEVNDDSKDSDFADFLANTDIDKVVAQPRPPTTRTPTKEEKSE
jgi:hypothetical protein